MGNLLVRTSGGVGFCYNFLPVHFEIAVSIYFHSILFLKEL